MKNPITISTYTSNDIYLAPITRFEDWLHIESLTNSPEYLKYDPEKPQMTCEQQQAFWRDSVEAGEFLILGIYAKENNVLIGHINAFDFDLSQSSCEIGINILPPENFGKGIGSAAIPMAIECLKAKGLRFIYILTHIQNIPSQRLFNKCGFEQVPSDEKEEVKMMYRY